jgi:hypothetical protein
LYICGSICNGFAGCWPFLICHVSLTLHIVVKLALFDMMAFSMQVVLAANDLPSINDVTYPELIEIISKVIERKTFRIVLVFQNLG